MVHVQHFVTAFQLSTTRAHESRVSWSMNTKFAYVAGIEPTDSVAFWLRFIESEFRGYRVGAVQLFMLMAVPLGYMA